LSQYDDLLSQFIHEQRPTAAPALGVTADARAVAARALADDAWLGHAEELTAADLDRIAEVVLASVANTHGDDSDGPVGGPTPAGYLAQFVAGLDSWGGLDAAVVDDLVARAAADRPSPEVDDARRKTAHERLLKTLTPWLRFHDDAYVTSLLEDAVLGDDASMKAAVAAAVVAATTQTGHRRLDLLRGLHVQVQDAVVAAGGDASAVREVRTGLANGVSHEVSDHTDGRALEEASYMLETWVGVVLTLPGMSPDYDDPNQEVRVLENRMLESTIELVSSAAIDRVIAALAKADTSDLVASVVGTAMAAMAARSDRVGVALNAVQAWFDAHPLVVDTADVQALAEAVIRYDGGLPALAEHLLRATSPKVRELTVRPLKGQSHGSSVSRPPM
jgi:hypothetical protein